MEEKGLRFIKPKKLYQTKNKMRRSSGAIFYSLALPNII